jgi:hypothetical protein
VAVEDFEALLRAEADKRFPASLHRSLEEAGQDVFKTCPFQVIEQDIRHQPS